MNRIGLDFKPAVIELHNCMEQHKTKPKASRPDTRAGQ